MPAAWPIAMTGGITRTAPARDEPLDDFVEEPAYDLRLAGLVVARHERPDEPARRHAAEAVAALDDKRPRAVPRRGNRRADPGRPTADDKYIDIKPLLRAIAEFHPRSNAPYHVLGRAAYP